MGTITKVVATSGASDIDERLEMRLVDVIIYSFQEQTTEDQVMLDGFGTVVNALGKFYCLIQSHLLITILSGIRVKPYLTQIILWRLNNKSAKVRQQAADLTTRLTVVIKQCGEDQQLRTLGLVLFTTWRRISRYAWQYLRAFSFLFMLISYLCLFSSCILPSQFLWHTQCVTDEHSLSHLQMISPEPISTSL